MGIPAGDIAPEIKYLNYVIPAKAGIQIDPWIPEQVRHDGFGYLDAMVITKSMDKPMQLTEKKIHHEITKKGNHEKRI